MTRAAIGYRTKQRSGDLLRSVGRAEQAAPEVDSALSAALRAIVTYIPTEIVTTYVAVLAALSDGGTSSRSGQWAAFVVFAALAPTTVWVLFATKSRTRGLPLPLRPHDWPLWEMVASALAFFAWAYALPDSPFNQWKWYRPSLGAAVLLLVSFGLGLVAPLFQPSPTK